MHFTAGTTPGISFNHNGDFSDDVFITIMGDVPGIRLEEPVPDGEEPGSITLVMPFVDLKHLVARYCAFRHVSEVERLYDNDDGALGFSGPTRGFA